MSYYSCDKHKEEPRTYTLTRQYFQDEPTDFRKHSQDRKGRNVGIGCVVASIRRIPVLNIVMH